MQYFFGCDIYEMENRLLLAWRRDFLRALDG